MKNTMIKEVKLPDLNGGLNVNDPEYGVMDNQSPDMLNMWFRGRALMKRDGQKMIVSGLDGSVHTISPMFNGFYAVHAGRCLYQWRNDTVQLIRSGLPNNKGVFCEFGDNLYYLDGEQIWEFSAEYEVSEIVPFVPCVMINALPDLSGCDAGDAYNLIGSGFTVKYNANGTGTVYSLPHKALDATVIKASVNAEDLIEGDLPPVFAHMEC